MTTYIAIYLAGVFIAAIAFSAHLQPEEDQIGSLWAISAFWPFALVAFALFVITMAPVWLGRKIGEMLP